MEFQPIPGVVVIGLGHRARQGKDVAAAAIIKAIDGAMRFSFADDLYAYCRVVHGMTTKDAPLLQRVGVEMRDTIHPDIWVRSVYAKMLDQRPRLAIIPDVRFANEIAFIKALGGKTVRVNRYHADGSMFVDPSRPANHISETALADAKWDAEIYGLDGDISSVQQMAVGLAQNVLATTEGVA